MSGKTSKETQKTKKNFEQTSQFDTKGPDELFMMANLIREDGLYNVQIADWKKVENPEDDRTEVEVKFDTRIDGIQKDTFNWPVKPTEDSDFIKMCMIALDLDDPKEASAQAGVLKEECDDQVKAKVPAERTQSGWSIKFDEIDLNNVCKEDQIKYTIYKKLGCISIGPLIMTVLAHNIYSEGFNMPDKPRHKIYEIYWDNIQCIYYGFIGTIIWLFVFFGFLII